MLVCVASCAKTAVSRISKTRNYKPESASDRYKDEMKIVRHFCVNSRQIAVHEKKTGTYPLSLTVGSMIPVYIWSLGNAEQEDVQTQETTLSYKLGKLTRLTLLPRELLTKLLKGWRSSYSRYLWHGSLLK